LSTLKGRKYVFIHEAADHLGISAADLFEWLEGSKTTLYAYSEFSDDVRPLDSWYSKKLLATQQTLKNVRFLYPKDIRRRFRLTGPGTDDQLLTRNDLKVSVKDLLNSREQIRDTYQQTQITTQKHGNRNKNVGVDGRGQHFKKKRKVIEDQVLKVVRDQPLKFRKKNGSVHIDELAKYLDSTKENWIKADKEPRGFSFENIKMVIRELKKSNQIPKITD